MKFIMFIKKSINRKLFVSYMLIGLLPLILSMIISYYFYTGITEKKALEYNYEIMKLMSEKLENYLVQIEQLSYTAYQENIQNILSKTRYDEKFQRVEDLIQIDDTFQRKLSFNNFTGMVFEIIIVKTDGTTFFMGEGAVDKEYCFSNQDWFKTVLEGQPGALLMGPHHQPYMQKQHLEEETLDTKDMRLSYVRRIGSIFTSQKNLGVIMINFGLDKISEMLMPLSASEKSDIYILSMDGSVIFSKKKDIVGKNSGKSILESIGEDPMGSFTRQKGKDRELVSYYKLEKLEWCIISTNRISDLIKETGIIKTFSILLSLGSIIIAVLISALLSRSLVKPIKLLRNKMHEAEMGNLNIEMVSASMDEVGELNSGFNNMIKRIRYLIDEVYKTQLKEKEAQLNALQAQINPHFLYNTLENINCIAKVEKVKIISDISKALAKMFRYSTKLGKITVPFSEELEHVKNYLKIIAVRFEDKFDFSISIPLELMDCKVLKLTLQPIVENAIYHGLETKTEKGHLSIQADTENGVISIVIKDNGNGIPAQRLEELKNMLYSEQEGIMPSGIQKTTNVGLKNVHDRIRFYFGMQYGIHVESGENTGTTVIVTIPRID